MSLGCSVVEFGISAGLFAVPCLVSVILAGGVQQEADCSKPMNQR